MGKYRNSNFKNKSRKKGFVFETIESVPVHEEIKYGGSERDKWIENYQKTLKNLSNFGIKTVCYNFMPIFDWTRMNLSYINVDGSTSLALNQLDLENINPLNKALMLPGWDTSYKQEELTALFDYYKAIRNEDLWKNLEYFLKAIIPTAKETVIKMAIHPDDPPYEIFGLPRIINNKESYERLFSIDNSIENGITFCTGSLGFVGSNDIYSMLDNYLKLKKVHFVHARNVKPHSNGDFEETAHASNYGTIDMVRIMHLLKENSYSG